ncbi:MAG: GFA family protein [Sphingomonas sp.]
MDGGCACGAVRYRLTDAPMIVHCCHCTSCQTETGSAFAVNAVIERNAVELLVGDPELVATPSESGKGQEIARCPACRVAVWSHYAGSGRRCAFVRVGTLDTPGALPPDVHIFTRTKLPWIVLPAGAPTFEGFYPDPATVWTDAARARFRAMRHAI